ncbi:MAG: hypothetical protein J1F12_01765 [Muribaculaceae bacterium]|nr:hypothetical protein [Muribaculaceae bacterium]
MKNKFILSGIILLISFFLGPKAFSAKAKAPVAEEVLQKARDAFFNYEFEEAAELYEEYEALKTKAKKPFDENYESFTRELNIASNAFDRVQKIVIVDSISVNRDKFYEAYRLTESTGKIEKSVEGGENAYKFINEAGDYSIYSKTGGNGELRLYESRILLDGNKEEEEILNGDFELSGDYSFPFMSGDGQTLYFANNGEESMGGFDIFVAQRDPITGEYLNPLNVGMPFNSPYDDIMMVLDEEKGIGWWATDRNTDDGKISVYVYLLDEIRKNYPSDTENLTDYARISSYKDTWIEGEESKYKNLMTTLGTPEKKKQEKNREFELNLGNGRKVTAFSDFRNRKSVDLMKQFISKEKLLSSKENNLQKLRITYKSTGKGEKDILTAESEIEDLRNEVKNIRNEIIRLEKAVR